MPWNLNGNVGTKPGQNFLGTTDNQPVVIKTNGNERVRVSNRGLELQTSRTYLLGADGGGGHWIMAGGTQEPQDNALGFNRANNEVIVNGGWNMQFRGARTYLLGADGVGNHWIMAGGTQEPQDNALGFNRANHAIVVNGGWNMQFRGARTYLLGADGVGNHWIMAGGTQEPQDNALGFNRANHAIVVNDGWDIQFAGADCAENFEAAGTEKIEPGTVVVVADDGKMEACEAEYDKQVAGVVSGAEGVRAGVLLNRNGSQRSVAVALIGKVHCNVDAAFSPIGVGDLLTTSPTLGHAMKAEDSTRAFGATLGKALLPLYGGRGRIPVLVALQ